MSRAQQAARETADEYRRQYGSETDDVRRMVLGEISLAFREFAEWLEDME